MSERPLVSVIVPVYKVESFLDRCVGSLVGQSYENIEIILVDDGSPDNCGAMCDAWAKKDGRIRVLHKANGGLSDARNKGVELARGGYICFVDSDDYVSPDCVEYLLSLLRDNDAQIACGGWKTVHEGTETFDPQPEEKAVCLGRYEACRAYMGEHYMQMVTAWGKLLPAQTVRDNPFPVGRLHEDEACTYKYYHQNEKTVIGSRRIYGYYQNSQSITHNKTRKNQEHTVLALEERCEYFRAAGDAELCAYTAERVLINLVSLAGLGEEVAREQIKSGQAEKYLKMGVRAKYRLFYHIYALTGLDLNAVLLKLKGLKGN